MRTRNLVVSMLLGVGVASCGENQPPAPAKPGPSSSGPYGVVTPAPQSPLPATPASAPQNASATPLVPASPLPPSNAQWTIACDSIEGPAHVAESAMLKQQLIQTSKMPDWYVIHTDTKSDIYYGYYGSIEDPAEKRREEADRRKIGTLLDHLGNPMVRGAVLTPVAMADPTAPPEWNLLNTPKDAYWTIEIATFLDNPKRKEAAVQMVEALRKQGETRAYYFHGPTVSSVCIGAWKREAIAEQGTGEDDKGHLRDDAHTQSADQPLLVIPDVVPGNIPGRVYEPGTGKPMTVEALKLEVLDPDMKAAMVKYHDHYVNYEAAGKTENGKFVADASMLVAIPHDLSPVTDDNWRIAGGQQTTPVPQPARAQNGDDVLRSIGVH
jgi:hypothetical protein